MNASFYFSQLQNFFSHWLGPLHNAALTTVGGETLFVQSDSLVDVGTLSTAAQIGHKYLQLNDGDVVIGNDPYSGGSTLTSFTFIMGLSSQASRKTTDLSPADLLLSYRVHLKPKVSLSEKVDDEGLRVPPSPLYIANNPPATRKNKELIDAICAHPQCPPQFLTFVDGALEALMQKRQQFKDYTDLMGLDWSKGLIKKYLKHSNKRLHAMLHDFTLGEATVEHDLADNTKIRLRLEVDDKKVVFDFTDTDASKHLNLTDQATYGACVGAFLSTFPESIPLNSGVFSVLEIVAPAGTVVNAVYPRPVFQGMTDGTYVIANMVTQALGKIDKQRLVAAGGISQCAFELEFSNQRYFYETVPVGAPASSQRKGTAGVNLWQRSHLIPRLELVEKLYPVRLNTYAFRANSGGSGIHQGGDGVTKAITTKEPATLRWLITATKQSPEGISGGKSANNAEIYVQRANEKSEKMPLKGEVKLEPGDTVIIHSAGGGGFGADKKESTPF